MKLLMFQARRFRFRSYLKTLSEAPDEEIEKDLSHVAVIFVHVEAEDASRRDKLISKMLKNVKWLANKKRLENVALHSFTHLSDSKAEPKIAHSMLEDLAGRLNASGYCVHLTPFGYTCEWDLEVYGESIAKVFKSL